MYWFWLVVKVLLAVYVLGFITTFVFHVLYLQMVTPPLALIRSAFWFLLWTGWFRGTPMPMD